MGRGIAQLAAAADISVLWYDLDAELVRDGTQFVRRMFDRLVEKDKISAEQATRAKSNIKAIDGLDDFKAADLVVEAIVEDATVKKRLFSELENKVSESCVLASNTSSIPISLLAADAHRPERIAGLHFFNPVPLMKIVEVISGLKTRETVIDQLVALGERMGHYAPRIKDSPGFLVNHAGRGYALEALRIQSEGVAEPAEIDRILCETVGFRMGPFALCDLIGIDVTHSVMESIYNQFYQEPRYAPSVITQLYKEAKLHGRKTGKGFYDYDDDGKPLPAPERTLPEGEEAPVWVGVEDAEAGAGLRSALKTAGCRLDESEAPGQESICLVAPLGEDATTYALRNHLPPTRTVAIDLLFGLRERVCLMAPPVIDCGLLYFVGRALRDGGHKVSIINDSPGFVVQRVVANIVNVSCDIAQRRIAAPEAINASVKLGLGYPKGSLEFGDVLGPQKILMIVEGLHEFYEDPRYRPSPWLKRRAMLGVSLSTKEGA